MALNKELEKQGVWLFRYRSYLPIVILFGGLYIYILNIKDPASYFSLNSNYRTSYDMLCFGVAILGQLIRIYTVGFSAKNTSGRNVTEQVADSVNTTGIYSTVRHPLYLGNFFMWLGPAMLTANLWFIIAFCLMYWVYYERIMYAEEQFLERKFGNIYTQWASKTPAFLPKFSQFVKCNNPFNWKKVLKKEKNGIFATFIIFAVFDILGKYLTGRNDYNMFFIWGTVVTALSYVVLKYLKYNSKLLEE